jgi:hypothetical protein
MNAAEPISPQQLVNGMRAWARGLRSIEAAVGLVIAHQRWLERRDFCEAAMWVELCDPRSEGEVLVGIDWEAAASLATDAPASSS